MKSTRYVRMRQLVGNPHAVPPVPGILPVSPSTVWKLVKRGEIPPPIKLSSRVTVFDVAAIEQWVNDKRGA